MIRELLRKAAAALQHARAARTIEYQIRHADEARNALEAAQRSLDVRRQAVADKPTAAARLIAERAIALERAELQTLDAALRAVEEWIAPVIPAEGDLDWARRARPPAPTGDPS